MPLYCNDFFMLRRVGKLSAQLAYYYYYSHKQVQEFTQRAYRHCRSYLYTNIYSALPAATNEPRFVLSNNGPWTSAQQRTIAYGQNDKKSDIAINIRAGPSEPRAPGQGEAMGIISLAFSPHARFASLPYPFIPFSFTISIPHHFPIFSLSLRPPLLGEPQ